MKNITKEQIIAWIGSDNETFDNVLDILHQVVNGKWKVEVLRSDIESYEDQEEEFEEYVDAKPSYRDSIWKGIRDSFVDEGIIHIDAWLTEEENDEDGRTIAKIEEATGKVLYIDERAKTDWYANETIGENVRTILEELKDDLDKTMDKIRDENF